RSTLVPLTNASGALDYRLRVWEHLLELLPLKPIEGWGWTGRWQATPPYIGFTTGSGTRPASALNAYIDVLFQLGLIGLAIFVGMVGLAFARSWLLAGRRRSITYAWPALSLVAIIVISLAESIVL